MLYRYSSVTNPQYSIIIHTNHTCSPVSRWRRVNVIILDLAGSVYKQLRRSQNINGFPKKLQSGRAGTFRIWT